ncbi:MAG: SLC13 family permease [Leptospirales bacterium]
MQSWGIGLLTVAVILLMSSGKVPVGMVASGVLVVLGISGLLPMDELFRGFAESSVFLIASLFILSEGMARAKVVRWIATTLTIHIGKRPFLLACALFPVSGILAMFLNDTGAVAIFLPLMTALLTDLGLSERRFLLPAGFAALLGGASTLIGSSSNVIVSGFLESRHLPSFQMFDFLPVGGGAFLIGLIYLLIVSPFLLGKAELEGGPSPTLASRKFYIEVRLEDEFPQLGEPLKNVPLFSEVFSPSSEPDFPGAAEEGERSRSFLKASWSLIRNRPDQGRSYPEKTPADRTFREGVFQEGDRLRLLVSVSQLQRIAEREGVEILSQSLADPGDPHLGGHSAGEGWESEENIVCEAIPAPRSGLIGRPLSTLSHVVGPDIAVVGIHRSDAPASDPLFRTIISHGDVLLLKIHRDFFDAISSRGLFLYLNEAEREVFRSEKALTALGILVLFVLASVFHWVPTVLAAIMGALAMVGFGIVRPEEARNAIEWRVIFLMGSMFPLGWALERSPLGSVLVHAIQGFGGGLGPEGALFLVLASTIVAVQFLSHTLVALFMAPVALSIATALHLSPLPFLSAVSLGAASVFLTPISHPVNTMTWGAGNYRFSDYVRVGVGLSVLVLLWGLWEIPRIWPFHP